MTMLRAMYETRGPVPQDVIFPVEFTPAPLDKGQVLLKVLASPINPSMVLTLTGQYGMLPPLPAVGGGEGVGAVQELGPDTQGPAIGQTVLLPLGSGTWATHVVANVADLIPLPNEADPQQLSMIAVNPPTAELMLSQYVDLKEGEWVIQNVANSGVGGYLVSLAKIRGLKTVNVVRRASAISDVQQLGGDVVLVDGPDLAQRVSAATSGAKIRLGVDAVGGEATGRLADCLCMGATLVSYGSMSGEPYKLSARSVIFNELTMKGFWLALWFRRASKTEQQAVFGKLAQLITKGVIKSNIHAIYDVHEIKEAVAAANTGERSGKVLIVPGCHPKA